ncbi:NAD-dependent epimerase/dehydratase family protein [Fusobacterium periodonticum]|uniref:NAD-dependent epimerase/dehydratase family protein n=1 Tax=Fusobacterium periodonticum TaxID=860 RepID=UPI0028D1F62D|nr:NAD-dependent epimerase/dehydratase family protein [Fusobacterium periodonticum]
MLNFSNIIVQEDMKDIYNEDILFNKLKNKSVLITGATGMLATYIVYFLYYLNLNRDINVKIYILARNRKKIEELFGAFTNDKNFIIVNQDVTNEILIKEKIDYIFHLASSANPKNILENPIGIIKANTLGTINICEFAVKNNALVFFASTREIYGKIEGKEFVKEIDMGVCDCLEDRACYPESKRISETICKSYNLQYGMKYQICRIAHVYGPGMNIDNDGRIMSDIISDIVNNRNIILKSDGSAQRAFCYLSDAVRAIFFILLNGQENDVFNLSNEEEEISIKDLARLATELFLEKNIKVNYQISNNNSNLYTNYKRSKLDNSKLYDLGWKIKTNLKEGIKKTVLSFL